MDAFLLLRQLTLVLLFLQRAFEKKMTLPALTYSVD